jgi:predicted TIM-barrel fold metal-dependent hydrolase
MHFGNSDVDLGNVQHVERLRAVFRAANSHGMAIVVHMRSTISRKRPYGEASARAFLERVLPAAPDVPVQIAHVAGAGGYDDPLVDEALAVFVAAIARNDARMRRVYFDVSGVAGLGEWKAKAARIAARIRELGVTRILYGSDGAGGGNATPEEAWAAFKQLPLTDTEFRTIATNVAPYLR